jgi:hypothetical protein
MKHDQVKWPSGFAPFYMKVRQHANQILTGTVIALDPSSGGTSNPGFSIWVAGELLTSGEITFGKKRLPVYDRLQILHDKVSKLTPNPPDVFALEMIRGQGGFSSHYLHWGIGATIAAARTSAVIETPMHAWKAVAKVTPGYIKGDAADAECIGHAIILLARKFTEEVETAS